MDNFDKEVHEEFIKIIDIVDNDLVDYKSKNNINKPLTEFYLVVAWSPSHTPQFKSDTPDVIQNIYTLAYLLARTTVQLKEKY